MLGQRTARRLSPLKTLHRDLGVLRRQLRSQFCLGLRLRRIGLDLGELQLKLLENGAALGRLAILFMAQLGDRKLELSARAAARLVGSESVRRVT
jgi:hypothetical protein